MENFEFEFLLNLNWRKNPYRRWFGLHCNPFAWTEKERGLKAMRLGIPKNQIRKYASAVGLSKEVIKILQTETEPGKKYRIIITPNNLNLREL